MRRKGRYNLYTDKTYYYEGISKAQAKIIIQFFRANKIKYRLVKVVKESVK